MIFLSMIMIFLLNTLQLLKNKYPTISLNHEIIKISVLFEK